MPAVIVVDARSSVLHNLPKRANGMEIGVWRGDFSAKILQHAQPKVLHLVDSWKVQFDAEYANAWYGAKVTQEVMDGHFQHVTSRFANEIAAGQVKIHRSHSVDAMAEFRDNSIDFVYVDGDHTFEGALADLRAALAVVRSGGLICGDDYVLGGWWKGGVVKALHTFLQEANVVIEFLVGSQFIVRKIGAA